MDVALAQARAGDTDESGALLQLLDALRAGIAHRRLHPAAPLVDHVPRRALERNLALDPFGDELQLILDVLLKIAIGRTARHRADTSHAAIGFIRTPLIEKGFSRSLFRSGEQRSDHYRRCARGQ